MSVGICIPRRDSMTQVIKYLAAVAIGVVVIDGGFTVNTWQFWLALLSTTVLLMSQPKTGKEEA
jgi:hypothetical protein